MTDIFPLTVMLEHVADRHISSCRYS